MNEILARVVEDNKRRIDEVLGTLSQDSEGDVFGKFPDLKVKNITAINDNFSINSAPSFYTKNITWEIKDPTVIKLNNYDGISGDSCLMMTTYDHNNKDALPVRTVYGSHYKTYLSEATSNKLGWKDWILASAVSNGSNVVISDNEPGPDVQKAGDSYLQPIGGTSIGDSEIGFLAKVVSGNVIRPNGTNAEVSLQTNEREIETLKTNGRDYSKKDLSNVDDAKVLSKGESAGLISAKTVDTKLQSIVNAFPKSLPANGGNADYSKTADTIKYTISQTEPTSYVGDGKFYFTY